MNKKLYKALYYLILTTIIILILLLFKLLKILDICCTLINIFIPIFFGYALAWILNPIYNKLNKKINKKISILLLILLLIIVYGTIIIIITPIINEAGNFANGIIDIIPKLKSLPFIKFEESMIEIKLDKVIESCGGIASVIINFILINMFAFYILYNYNIIKKYIRKLIPYKYKSISRKISNELSSNMYLFVRGTLLDTLFMFFLTFVLFLIFGIKHSVILATFISITNIIPFIGPYIGGIPAVLVGFACDIKTGIIATIIVIVSQLIESNLINPLIMSKITKINPLLIVISITVIGSFFGIVATALTIPILIFIKVLYKYIKQYKKEL